MNNEDKGKKAAAKLDADIQKTVSTLPKSNRSVAIIHTTNMGITMEKDSSIAGCCAKLLHLRNIVKNNTVPVAGPMGTQPDMAPYSLEHLVEINPDIIFITSMGEKRILKENCKAKSCVMRHGTLLLQ